MAYSDIIGRVTVTGFVNAAGDPDPNQVHSIFSVAYNGSTLLANAVNGWLAANPTKNIEVEFLTGAAQAFPNQGRIQIDPLYFVAAHYISKVGTAVSDSFLSGFVHELSHAVTGLLDNNSFTNPAGDNVDRANQWFRQLGIAEQASYQAYEQVPSVLIPGENYTNGATIENAILDEGSYNNNGFSFDSANVDLLANGVNGSALIIGSQSSNDYGGTNQDDFIYGGSGSDALKGHGGNDKIYGEDDIDLIDGGAGEDELFGGAGSDTLMGGSGNDKLYGEDGQDTYDGGAGNDVIFADAADQEIDGGSGYDTLDYSNSDIAINWEALKDGIDISGIEKVVGSSGDDVFTLSESIIPFLDERLDVNGSAGDDRIRGNSQANNLNGGGGDDDIWGEAGDDTLSGGAGDDGIEGNGGEDKIYGGSGDDNIDGGAEADELFGGTGDDDILGGDGNDLPLTRRTKSLTLIWGGISTNI